MYVLLVQCMHVNQTASIEDKHCHCSKMFDGVGSMMQPEQTFSELLITKNHNPCIFVLIIF